MWSVILVECDYLCDSVVDAGCMDKNKHGVAGSLEIGNMIFSVTW